MLVALADRLAIVDVRTGELEPLVDIPHAHPGLRANDGAVDPAGRFWIGTMADDESPDKGALYRLDGRRADHGARAGLALQRARLDRRPHVLRRHADPARRRARLRQAPARSRTAARSRRSRRASASPDGLVLDDEGGVWLALYGGAQVRRYSPDGVLDAKLAVPADNVTACWFAGDAAVHHHRRARRSRWAAACSSPSPACQDRLRGHTPDHDHRRRPPATSASPPRRASTAPTR